jgi:flagellar biosynthesis/type III secretory pathway protein FliH
LIATVIAATERVVLSKLDTEPAVLDRWAAAAIDACNSAKRYVVLVHPETLASHGEALEQLLSKPGMPEDSRIEPDESIEPAGVVVRTDGGAVALTLSDQLQRLDEMLRGDAT